MEDQRQILTFALRTELGHDRLGRVFRAVDQRTMKPVIVRLLRVGSLVPRDREEAVRVELRRLMRAAANVAHPNLAPIIDIASYRDLEIVAWDDVGGAALEERLLNGAPAVEALRWAIETASAIVRAHSRGVPHGRISLANLVVGRDDSVRVLDLGVPRPRAVPFLVEDEPDAEGVHRPVRRNLPKLIRRDLGALAEVVQTIVSLGPPHADDRRIREEISEAVREACAAVLEGPRPTVAQLHLALVEVARRTPADSRRTSGLLALKPPPAQREDDDEPGGEAAAARPEPLPFALADYENPRVGRDRLSPPQAPPLRVWGAAAFDLDDDEPEEEEVVRVDPREPPQMSSVMLPPMAPEELAAEREAEVQETRRLWPQFAVAVIIGVLLAFGLFALDEALSRGAAPPEPAPQPLAVRDAVELPTPAAPTGAEQTALSAPPRPVAGAGQPAGTLVITVTQPNVQVSVDGSRAEPAPVTWDRLPAGPRVLRLSAAGYTERIDTVDVRADLTTTRFYILTPAR